MDQLVHFLNDEQRDPRLNEILFPHFNKEKAAVLIKQYEPFKQLRDQGIISMYCFSHIDPFPKGHRLVHNGGFPKSEARYCSLNMVNSTEIS